MKKLLVILLAIICAMPAAWSAAEEGAEAPERTVPWPAESFEGVDVSLRPLKDSEQRHQSYFGPDTKYHGNGAYKPAKASNVKALFREGDFTLVDMEYPGQGRRVLYFRTSAVTGGEAEAVTLTGYPAKTSTLLIAMQGPGMEYESVMQTVPSPWLDLTFEELVSKFGGSWEIYEAMQDKRLTIVLDPETEISVFFEMNGWVFAEFSCSLGVIRAWLPAEYVVPE